MSKLSEWVESHKDQPEHESVVRRYNMNSDLMEREFAEADSGMSDGNTRWLGHGGSKFYYRKIGETQIRRTNNMWYQGKIPERLNVPDNAVMCTKQEFDAQ